MKLDDLTMQEIQAIVFGLHEANLPYKLTAPLLQKIEAQVNDQIKPPEETKDADPT